MLEKEYTDGASLWIIKCQNYLSNKFHSKLLASISMIYLPVMLSGLLLQLIYHFKIFTRGVSIALVWIAFGPFLIQSAFKIINNYFKTHKRIFRNESEWKEIYYREKKRLQSWRYMLFGIPWTVAVTMVIMCSTYKDAPVVIKGWALITFLVMFLVTSIGFYGLYIILSMINKMLDSDIIIYPYHPDRFCGLADVGRLGVKVAFLFSSGALIVPLPLEILNSMGSQNNYINILVCILVGIFIATMFAAFLVPIFQVKKYVDYHKEELILHARHILDERIDEFIKEEDINLKKGIDIAMYYYFTYSKMLEIKEYPFDFRVLFEFACSFIIPIGVVILQIYFK
jgi:hypothetical protein